MSTLDDLEAELDQANSRVDALRADLKREVEIKERFRAVMDTAKAEAQEAREQQCKSEDQTRALRAGLEGEVAARLESEKAHTLALDSLLSLLRNRS